MAAHQALTIGEAQEFLSYHMEEAQAIFMQPGVVIRHLYFATFANGRQGWAVYCEGAPPATWPPGSHWISRLGGFPVNYFHAEHPSLEMISTVPLGLVPNPLLEWSTPEADVADGIRNHDEYQAVWQRHVVSGMFVLKDQEGHTMVRVLVFHKGVLWFDDAPLPAQIAGVPVQVVECAPQPFNSQYYASYKTTGKLFMGMAIKDPTVKTLGTSGAYIKMAGGAIACLTAAHVLHNGGIAQSYTNDLIAQANTTCVSIDMSVTPLDNNVGELAEDMNEYVQRVLPSRLPGMTTDFLFKSGAGTGDTFATGDHSYQARLKVQVVEPISMQKFPHVLKRLATINHRHYLNQLVVPNKGKFTTKFCDLGDSGSMVFRAMGGHLARMEGMVVAGDDLHVFLTPVDVVERRMNDLYGANQWSWYR